VLVSARLIAATLHFIECVLLQTIGHVAKDSIRNPVPYICRRVWLVFVPPLSIQEDQMKYQYPLSLKFKITTLSSDFEIADAQQRGLFYVRQKRFKLLEEINVFQDASQKQRFFTIKANKWLDFSAAYNFTNAAGQEVGKVARKGWASIWSAHYDIYNSQQNCTHVVREENAWVKVIDSIIGEIPIIGLFTGYFLNPAYLVRNSQGQVVAKLKKEPSLIGRRFKLEKLINFNTESEEEYVLLGLMMMVMLERQRG
jgi:uncharacterized protein YxjI